jgi:gamma-glutamyltranspeptidase/glutathione hydrolase
MEFTTGGILVQSRIVRLLPVRRQCVATKGRGRAVLPLLLAAASLAGCQTLEEGPHGWLADVMGTPAATPATSAAAPEAAQPETPTTIDTRRVQTSYLGSLAADDPQAVDIGRQVLQSRGTAADAAAAMGLALTVTLPSRAGIDGAGICLVHEAGQAVVQELDFVPPPVTGAAQIPGLARGLAALQARDGVLRWQQAVGLAEKQAQTGIAVTPPLLADLNQIGMAGGLKLGDVLPQRSVAATLARLRVAGASDIHTGQLAVKLVESGLPADALARWVPAWHPAALESTGDHQLYRAEGAGGRLSQQAWQALAGQAQGDAAAAYGAARAAAGAAAAGPAPVTSFVVADAKGQAVACAIGMGGTFGTGKLIEGLDVYAATPVDPATLAPLVALSGSDLVGAFAGGGSRSAPAAAAAASWLVLARGQAVDAVLAADPVAIDRLTGLSCPDHLPHHPESCVAATDAHGGGWAMNADRL